MTRPKAYQTRQAKPRQRRRLQAPERRARRGETGLWLSLGQGTPGQRGRPAPRRRRALAPLVATAAGPGHRADAYDGPLVWRVLGGVVWCYPARVLGKGPRTMEEIMCRLKYS